MKAKNPKTYTLNQVGKALKISGRCVRNYVYAGLIHLTPGETYPMMITEEELQRIKRDGIDSTGIYTVLAKLHKRNRTTGVPAKKRAKRAAAAAPAPKPAKKQSAYARQATKKQVKRNAAAAGKTASKKPAKRKK